MTIQLLHFNEHDIIETSHFNEMVDQINELSVLKEKIKSLEEDIKILLCDDVIKERIDFIKSRKSKYKIINL